MWGKLLKNRQFAKSFYRVEVGNGEETLFWFDTWSKHGCLMDVVGENGPIDFGIGRFDSVAKAMRVHRRRKHRVGLFNEIEEEFEELKNRRSVANDRVLWKQKDGRFKHIFSSSHTWNLVRSHTPMKE